MVERFSEYSGSFPAIPNDEGEFVRFSDYATLEAQLAGQETTLWARFKDILSALEATPPAPKVTDEMVSAACDSFLRANTTVRTVGFKEMRAALTAAQEAGRP